MTAEMSLSASLRSTRGSELLTRMQQCEEVLKDDLKALQASEKKLHSGSQILATDKQRLDHREQEIAELEGEIAERKRKLLGLAGMRKSTSEVAQQAILLLKAAADMRQYVECDQMTSFSDIARAKAVRFENLVILGEALDGAIRSRENEVIWNELEAALHQEVLNEAGALRKSLEQRRKTAEARRELIFQSIQERSARREAILERRREIRKLRETAEADSAELDVTDRELRLEEDRLEDLRNRERCETENADRERSASISVAIARGNLLRSQYSSRKETLLSPGDFVEQCAGNVLEVEMLEAMVAERKAAFEKKHEESADKWAAKQAEADAKIEELEKKLSTAGEVEELKDRLRGLQSQHDEIKRKTGEVGNALKDLTEGPESKLAQAAKLEEETREERQKIAELKRQLSARETKQKVVEVELSRIEEGINKKRDDVVMRGRLIGLRESTARKMIEVYERELAAAEKRCDELRARQKSGERSVECA